MAVGGSGLCARRCVGGSRKVWVEVERRSTEPEETLMSRGRRPSCTSAPRKTGEKSEFRGRVKGSGPV